jgi:hypothetical protein
MTETLRLWSKPQTIQTCSTVVDIIFAYYFIAATKKNQQLVEKVQSTPPIYINHFGSGDVFHMVFIHGAC